jgi:hypothetical protein
MEFVNGQDEIPYMENKTCLKPPTSYGLWCYKRCDTIVMFGLCLSYLLKPLPIRSGMPKLSGLAESWSNQITPTGFDALVKIGQAAALSPDGSGE